MKHQFNDDLHDLFILDRLRHLHQAVFTCKNLEYKYIELKNKKVALNNGIDFIKDTSPCHKHMLFKSFQSPAKFHNERITKFLTICDKSHKLCLVTKIFFIL